MDWAIEFPLVGYRETQRKWLWIKGKSLHVSVAVNKRADGEVEVECGKELFLNGKASKTQFSTISNRKKYLLID